MSGSVLPDFPGKMFPFQREVDYYTATDESANKRIATLALQQYPIYTYKISYELLLDTLTPSEIKLLVGFYNQMGGRFDSFLYTDPVFNTVIDEVFAVADGTSTNYQIIATLKASPTGAGAPDIIQNFNGAPVIKDNGSTVSPTLGPTGIVTFGTPPTSGHILTWSGQFYQRCHFLNDTLQVKQILYRWWSCDELAFQSVLL